MDMSLAGNFDGRNRRRVQRKNALDSSAKADPPDRESFALDARPRFFGNHHAFKRLDAFLNLFAFAFLQAHIHFDGIAGAKFWQILAQLRVV